MTLNDLIKGSWSLYRFRYEEDTVEKALSKVDGSNWILFLLYSYIFYLFASLVNEIGEKSISDFFTFSTYIKFFLVESLSFLGIYVLILLGFYFVNLFFRSELKFSDYYIVLIYIQLPIHSVLILLLLFAFIPYVNIVSTMILGFILFFLVLMSLGIYFVVMSRGFGTSILKLIGVVLIWAIIATILIMIVMVILLPFIVVMSFFSVLLSSTGGEVISGETNVLIENDDSIKNKIEGVYLSKYNDIDLSNYDEIMPLLSKKHESLSFTSSGSSSFNGENVVFRGLQNKGTQNESNIEVLFIETVSGQFSTTKFDLPPQESKNLEFSFTAEKNAEQNVIFLIENENGFLEYQKYKPSAKKLIEEKGVKDFYCIDLDGGSKYTNKDLMFIYDISESSSGKYSYKDADYGDIPKPSFIQTLKHGGSSIFSETCSRDDENILYELVCNESELPEVKEITCEKGCEKGVCIT